LLSIFLFLGFITQTVGMVYTTASNSAFITGTYIVILPFIQYFIIKKIPSIANVAGIILVSIGFANVAGIILVSIGLVLLTGMHSFNFNFGDMLTFICALAFAFHILYVDIFTSEENSDFNALLFGQFIGMLILCTLSTLIFENVLCTLSTLIFENGENFKFTPKILSSASLIINSVMSTFVGIYLINKYQKYTTPVKAGLIYSMEQVFAVIFSIILLNELFSSVQIAGAIFIFSGFMVSDLFFQVLWFQRFLKKEDKIFPLREMLQILFLHRKKIFR